MRIFILLLFIIIAKSSYCQVNKSPLYKRVMIRTNVLNILNLGPSFSIDKALSNTNSIEIAYMAGHFNHFYRTDHYEFTGILVRIKKYFIPLNYNQVSPYAGIYTGLLKRIIQRHEFTGTYGIGNYSARDFTGNSIRSGGSGGFSFTTKNRINFDVQGSLGYGKYYNQFDKMNKMYHSKGYFDIQLWAAIGYCF